MNLKSLGKALRDQIIESDEPPQEGEQTAAAKPAQEPATASLGSIAPVVNRPTQSVRSITADPALVEQIVEHVSKGTSAAYKSFQEKLGVLTMVPEGPMRIQAACAAANIKPNDIIAELDRRLTKADEELHSVEAIAEQKRADVVGSLETQVSEIDNNIKLKRDEIARLEEQSRLLKNSISEEEQRRSAIVEQIPGEEAKITAGVSKFRQAHGQVQAQLRSDKATLTAMLSN